MTIITGCAHAVPLEIVRTHVFRHVGHVFESEVGVLVSLCTHHPIAGGDACQTDVRLVLSRTCFSYTEELIL